MKKIGLSLLLLCSVMVSVSEGAIVFDKDVYYDIYFSGRADESFVMRKVKISESNATDQDSYVVVRSDRALKEADGRGYIFMRGISAVVPSDYFRVEHVQRFEK